MWRVKKVVDSDSSCACWLGKRKHSRNSNLSPALMRLRPQIPFLLTSKPLNSFEFECSMVNRKMKISPLAWKMKKNHRRLTCHVRIAFLSLPNHGFSFQVFELECIFFFNFTLACQRKVFPSLFWAAGGYCDVPRAPPQRHSCWWISESDFAASWRRQFEASERATLNGLERCSRMADYERSRRRFPQLFYKIQFRSAKLI